MWKGRALIRLTGCARGALIPGNTRSEYKSPGASTRGATASLTEMSMSCTDVITSATGVSEVGNAARTPGTDMSTPATFAMAVVTGCTAFHAGGNTLSGVAL